MRKTIIFTLSLLVFGCIGIIGNAFVSNAEEVKDDRMTEKDIKDKLVPLPRDIQVLDGSLEMTESVNILGQETADQDALNSLKAFLTENGIEVNDTIQDASTTIALGEEGSLTDDVKDIEKELDATNEADLSAEGYVLNIDSQEAGGTIFLKGADGAGTFYGVKTLIQLANTEDASLTFANLHIVDEPSMRVRGIIEGFYGSPWDQADRLDQIEFYGDYKMNTYIYAPKDDPYHREKWREPYPESELDRMEELIQTANQNKVNFTFAISPGIDIRFDGEAGEEDFQALIEKSESLYDMGVRDFAILFDDIDNKDGKKHGELLNRFNEEFIKEKEDVHPLITVPTEYDTIAMGGEVSNISKYTKALSETIDDDITVMWTGQVVVSESLPLENVQFMQEVYGDQIGVWWNYPVSDYLTSKLALGPIVDIDKRLEGEVDFFTMNPMEHANMSKITLATGGDYSWNIPDYDSDRSWNRSIELLFGDLADEMKTFANHSSRMTGAWSIGRKDAPNVKEMINDFWANVSKRKDVTEDLNQLEEEFTNMVQAAETLKSELPAEILNESERNLDKLQLLGEKAQLALDMVMAKVNQEDEEYDELYEELESSLPALNRGARVSEETVLAFIKDAMDFDTLPTVSFDASKTLVAPGEAIEFSSTSSLTTEELEWSFEGAAVETSTEENPTVVYDKEGIYTVKLVGKNVLGEDEVIKEGFITVTELANQETTNLALNKEATASSICAPTEGAEKAFDGSTWTKWCANGAGPHTLTVDLGSTNLVSEIIIKHAETGGEPVGSNTAAYRVLISEDGENFEELVQVTDNESGITKDQVPATKGQYVRLIIDKPTQGDDNAARIYELEVNGLEGDVELPPVYTPEEPELVENADELKALVQEMADEGAIQKQAVRPLIVHLETVSHFEKKGSANKVVKHMEGFKQILDHTLEKDRIDEASYNTLLENADHLIEIWK